MGTVRYRSDGTQLWTQSLPVRALAVDESGDVVVTGELGTAKYAAMNGALLWERRVTARDYRDFYRSVVLDETGDVIMTGVFGNQSGPLDFVTAKLNSLTGELLWERHYDGSGEDVVATANGDVVVTGTSEEDFLTAKLGAEDGASRWEVRHNSSFNGYDSAEALAFDGDGNLIVAGREQAGDGYEYRIAKHSAGDGTLLWKQQTRGDSQVWATHRVLNAVAVDSDGNVIAAGSASRIFGPSDYYIAKYSGENGAQFWDQSYEGVGPGHAAALAIRIDEQNGVIATGSAGTVKYSARGALVWSNPEPGEALALDSEYVYLVGHANMPDLPDPGYTVKRSARDGKLLWEVRYPSPEDRMRGIVVDSDGNVIVTGQSSNSKDLDCYTAKYAGADGSLIWERHHNGGAGAHDSAEAIALDAAGNVLITGYVEGGDEDFDGGHRYTAKYAAKNGAQIWERRDRDVARGKAVVVTAHGDVLVSGADFNEPGYHTAMYDGMSGTLLGESRLPYKPRGQGLYLTQLSSRSVALRHDGALALTGSFDGDVVTVLYRKGAAFVSAISVSRSRTSSGVQIQFTGSPGSVYRLERGIKVGGPWELLANPVAASDGVVEYVDQSALASMAFYRVRHP